MYIEKKNPQKPTDFFVPIEGVGTFRFNRKTYSAQIRIDAELLRILGPGPHPTDPTMNTHAAIVATYKALMVECPAGWEDLEAIDLTEDPDIELKILDVYMALRGKLHSFRKPAPAEQAGEGAGAGDAQVDGVLGPQQVQPVTDGPTVSGADA